jgi:hypothetical protein
MQILPFSLPELEEKRGVFSRGLAALKDTGLTQTSEV